MVGNIGFAVDLPFAKRGTLMGSPSGPFQFHVSGSELKEKQSKACWSVGNAECGNDPYK